MPDVVGLTQKEATARLSAIGVNRVSTTTNTVTMYQPGLVTSETPPAGSHIDPSSGYFALEVSALPPAPPSASDVARTFAGRIADSFSGVSYAVLTSQDGYVLKCSTPCHQNARQVHFKTTLAIAVNGKTPGKTLYKAIKQVVTGVDAPELQQAGFDYVLIAFPDRKKGNDTIALGYSLADWARWGTSQQPKNPTLALITNKSEHFKAA